jgi:hypothetical protein
MHRRLRFSPSHKTMGCRRPSRRGVRLASAHMKPSTAQGIIVVTALAMGSCSAPGGAVRPASPVASGSSAASASPPIASVPVPANGLCDAKVPAPLPLPLADDRLLRTSDGHVRLLRNAGGLDACGEWDLRSCTPKSIRNGAREPVVVDAFELPPTAAQTLRFDARPAWL